jgi:hypothetical protein
MNTEQMIEQLDAAITKLQPAGALLVGTDIKRAAGRPKMNGVIASIRAVVPTKRVISAEGRARIAKAQKARWAAKRMIPKKAAAKTANKAVKGIKAVTVPKRR